MSVPNGDTGSARRGLLMTGLLALVYFGFIGLVAFTPGLMSRPVIGVISVGLVAALAVIVFSLFVTFLYVRLGNIEEHR